MRLAKKKPPVCRACGHLCHMPMRLTDVGYCPAGDIFKAKPCGCPSCRCGDCINTLPDEEKKVARQIYPKGSETEGGFFF